MLLTESLPIVSVCIPTYNRAVSLKTTLESVINQDYPNLEVIVLDNASTDNTQAMVEKLSESDSRIYYYRNKVNIGAANNFNKVIRLASNEYCMWLADDDWLDPNYISVCLNAFEPDVALVSGSCEFVSNGQRIFQGQSINLVFKNPLIRIFLYYLQVGDNSIFYGIQRKSKLGKSYLKDVMGSDWFFMATIIYQGKVITVNNTCMHRFAEGASNDLGKLARSIGTSKLVQWEPYIGVGLGAFQDIINNDDIYSTTNKLKRYLLASLVFLVIFMKKVIVQKIYRIVRFRIRKKV